MPRPCDPGTSCGISPSFLRLSLSQGQIGHVSLTRSPLGSAVQAPPSSYDLHVLSAPPAFVLSQDQTLRDVWKSLNSSLERWISMDPFVRNLRWLTRIVGWGARNAANRVLPEGHSAPRLRARPLLTTSIVKKARGGPRHGPLSNPAWNGNHGWPPRQPRSPSSGRCERRKAAPAAGPAARRPAPSAATRVGDRIRTGDLRNHNPAL